MQPPQGHKVFVVFVHTVALRVMIAPGTILGQADPLVVTDLATDTKRTLGLERGHAAIKDLRGSHCHISI